MTENIREQSELLEIRLEQQEKMSEIAKGLIGRDDIKKLIRTALAKIGYFMGASRVIVISIDEESDVSRIEYSWYAQYAPKLPDKMTNLKRLIVEQFPGELPDGNAAPMMSCKNAAEQGEDYKSIAERDTGGFIWASLYLEGQLWGILSVEQCFMPRIWDENENRFVAMTASTIAGAIMRDIYDEKLKEAMESASAASKAKGEFLSNMSHEMRTPLNAIIGMTAIGKSARDIERKDYALNKVEDASTHLLGVINDVLDMSKIEANKLELSFVPFNFEKMVQKILTVINFRVNEKAQHLTVHIDNNVPHFVVGDDQRLAQVIVNLLSNAVKFTPDGGEIQLNVILTKQERDVCELQIEVADSGIGLSAEQQSKLFQPFQQAESSTSRQFGGTGLGLAISRRIVDMMDGEIWVESELGQGARFIFTIQVTLSKAPEEMSQDAAGADDEDIDLTGRTILLAEDVDVNREILISLLEDTGVIIDVAENGKEAFDMVRATPDKYDLVFMDVRMPVMDGLDATKHIRILRGAEKKRLPIVAMTANVFKDDIDECLAAGMDGHVGKPIDLAEVFAVLRKYLK